MDRRTHYMVLGVSTKETPAGIREAYRDRAKRLHPDVAGEQATPAFVELTQAFDVLSDRQRREAYNEQLQELEARETAVRFHQPPSALVHQQLTVVGEPETISPSFDAMHQRFSRNFTGRGVPKSEHLEGLNFEVLLTPLEAQQGCIVPLGVPVFRRCPYCAGTGHSWLLACVHCRQQGVIESEQIVRIPIPPMVQPGAVVDIPLHGVGIHNFYLRLHVVVPEAAR